MNRIDRRQFLGSATAAVFAAPLCAAGESNRTKFPLAKEVGITTSSLSRHLTANPKAGQFSMLELPRVMRDELDMRVIDLNTSSLGTNDPAFLDRCRAEVEKAGCVIINLKMNQRGFDMGSPDSDVRAKALAEYKRSIDTAARLGARWARPLPTAHCPSMDHYIASYRELADYAEKKNVQMLVENFGWMDSDPNSVPTLIKAIDRNVAVSPDTGNWVSNEVRYPGLEKIFPLAVTCDFKARKLGPRGEHPLYDLERCFEIGWKAGFRGPWCLEHANADRKTLFRELALLRDMLRGWMKERTG